MVEASSEVEVGEGSCNHARGIGVEGDGIEVQQLERVCAVTRLVEHRVVVEDDG